MSWLHRIRAGLIVAVVWGVTWGLVGTGIALLERANPILAGAVSFGRLLGLLTDAFLSAGLMGLTSGALFSMLLAVAERDRRIEHLSSVRVGLSGAATAAVTLLALVWLGVWAVQPLLQMVFWSVLFAALGGISSMATLSTARRASIAGDTEPGRISAT